MSKRGATGFAFGAATSLPVNERTPSRPDQVHIWLRVLVVLCLLVIFAFPTLEQWASTDPTVMVQEGAVLVAPTTDETTAFVVLTRHRFAVWFFEIGAYLGVTVLGLGGVVVFVGELMIAAYWLVRERCSLDRVEGTYLRIRPLRPQSRKGTRTAGDPLDLWRGLHTTLQQAPSSGSRPWIAFTMHARPEEPASLGAIIAAPMRLRHSPSGPTKQPDHAAVRASTTRRTRFVERRALAPVSSKRTHRPVDRADTGYEVRQSLKRAVTKMILGQDAETIVDEVPDPLQALLKPGMVVCWQELQLTKPPHFPIRTPDDITSDTLGSLTASLKTPPGVLFTELQIIMRPRPDSDIQTPWRVHARRRYVGLRRKDILGTTTEAKTLETKLHSEVYDVSVRIVAVAESAQQVQAARAAIRELYSAYGQYQTRSAAGRQMFQPAGFVSSHAAVVPARMTQAGNDRAILVGGLGAVCASAALGAAGIFLVGYLGLTVAAILLGLWAIVAGFLLLKQAPLARATGRTPRITPLPALLLPMPLWASPMILSSAEASGLWHLPSVELKTLINWLPNRYLPAQPHTFIPDGATDRIVFGYAMRSDGTEAPVGPSLRALRQVLHVTAGMGAGKTRAAANMAYQLVPNGFFEMDGKGDDLGGSLAATTLTYIPLEDEERLVLVDVLDADWPVGLNPLHGVDVAAPGGMTQIIGMILAVFSRLDPETWSKSQGMQQYAQMGAALVAETVTNPTLATLKQAIQDETYRATLLPNCTNIEVKNFWEVTFPQVGDQQKTSRDALLRRLDNLMVDETTRYLITQPLPTIDFLDCMERGRIVIIPLPHRTLGGIAEFIGMLLLQAVMRAAFRRPGSDQTRATVPLIIDELQIFIGKGDSKDIQDAITQLRGFGIGGAYFHQTLAQLGTLRDEMLTNSASRIILRTQEPDASAYAKQFPTTDLTPADISGQNFNDHQYAIFVGGESPSDVCSIRPLLWPTPRDGDTGIPDYHGPNWQTILPEPDTYLAPAERELGAETLEVLITSLIYGEIDAQYVAAHLALLPDEEWEYISERWNAIRAAQRAYMLANPGCIPFDESITHPEPEQEAALRRADRRRRRQQWLSRLDSRTPRVFAAAAYQRQRWAFNPTEEVSAVKPRKETKAERARASRDAFAPASTAYIAGTERQPGTPPPHISSVHTAEDVMRHMALERLEMGAFSQLESVRMVESRATQRSTPSQPKQPRSDEVDDVLDFSVLDGE